MSRWTAGVMTWSVLAWERRIHKISRFTHLNYQALWCKIDFSLVCFHRYLFNKIVIISDSSFTYINNACRQAKLTEVPCLSANHNKWRKINLCSKKQNTD